MDTSDPDIKFDVVGNCNHCSDFFSNLTSQTYILGKSEAKVKKLVEKVKKDGEGKKYNCIVGVSGGIDSTYLVAKTVELGLRPLMVHMNNGWNKPTAEQNIKIIADKLNVDLESVVLDWEEFREIQLAFLRSSIVDVEIPTDLAIPAALHQTAAKYGIKHIFSGGNYATEGILPRVWGYHGMKDMRLYNHIVKKYGKIKRKKTPKFGIWEEFFYKFFKGIRMSYLLNYVNYDKSSAQQELINKYGIHPFDRKHSESIYTSFFQVYVMPVKYGFDYRRATYASQICSGKLTREEAILLLTQPSYDSSSMEEDKAYICKKLGLHLSEFDSLMNASPLTYRDFPNSEKWIEFVHSVYKKLYPKK
jgi:N-acetyl sugar amidotransferase